MPERKVTVTYLCGICSYEYQSQEDARDCEKDGVAIPEFERKEVVKLVGFPDVPSGTKGIIHSEGGESDFNPHLLSVYYEVWTKNYFGSIKRKLVCISREHLVKVEVEDNVCCPLCNSNSRAQEGTFDSDCWLFPLVKVVIQKCLGCGAEFLTTNQLRKAQLIVQKKVRWPLVDTRRLVKEHQFQY